MKSNKLVVYILLMATCALPLMFLAQERKGSVRSHHLLNLEDGRKVPYSEIQTIVDSSKSKSLVMMDLGNYGKWVFEESMENNISTAKFKLLATGEMLTIKIEDLNGHFAESQITLTSGKGKLFSYKGVDVPKAATSFCPFVVGNFSDEFLTGLNELKLVDTAASLPPMCETYFMVIWSWQVLDKQEVTILKQRAHEKDQVQLTVDCDFDATFGYPCSKNEIPLKDGKSMLIPAK